MNLMKYLRSPKKSLREQALSSIEKGDLNEWASEELWLIGQQLTHMLGNEAPARVVGALEKLLEL